MTTVTPEVGDWVNVHRVRFDRTRAALIPTTFCARVTFADPSSGRITWRTIDGATCYGEMPLHVFEDTTTTYAYGYEVA